ncbi:MAG TPA: SOS response-associated peptidase family protein [Rhizomicrobium sp.]|nr:SOS response-associated peptidase family protein [Rhizomicrobium sp.]
MCGKFTAKLSWTELVDFAHSSADVGENDRSLIYRVMSNLPVIVLDRETGKRRVVAMRWGFPDPADWRKPRPIHARSERIDKTADFAQAFHDGQRGIVLVDSFNEAPENGEQHTITPGEAIGIAFVWRRFEVAELPAPLLACVMVTVAANQLVARLPTDRMPAVLAPEEWARWLGEEPASPAEVKACLKTAEGVRWTMTRQERTKTARRGKPTVSSPAGLF